MAAGDTVTSESTLFWKLLIKPTEFHGHFCESVTRHFESEPEPCSRQDHRWKISFTENMTNGVATTDIAIYRIRVEPPLPPFQQQRQQRPGQGQQHHVRDQEEKAASLAQSRPQESPQARLLPPRIHYKTIVLHTPRRLIPIIPIFLDKTAREDVPIRFELDASDILYRNLYQFEIVFSEETSTYQIPSLSSCHQTLDSLFYEVTATLLPNPATADIWFEFHPKTGNSHRGNCVGDAVAVVGAHEHMLCQRPFLKRWIREEREKQERQRRIVLQREWRVHSQQQRQFRHPIDKMHHDDSGGDDMELIDSRSEMQYNVGHTTDLNQAVLEYMSKSPPASVSPSVSSHPSLSDSMTETIFDSGKPRFSPSQVLQMPSHSSCGLSVQHDGPSEGALRLPSTLTGPCLQRATSVSSVLSGSGGDAPLLPALRIRVDSISQDTFEALLQYIYTGQIGLSEQQLTDIEIYWNDSLEDHQLPQGEVEEGQPPSGGSTAIPVGKEQHGPPGRQYVNKDQKELQLGAPIVLPRLKSFSAAPILPLDYHHSRNTDDVGVLNRPLSCPTYTAPLYEHIRRPGNSVSAMTPSSPIYKFSSELAMSSRLPCAHLNQHQAFYEDMRAEHSSYPWPRPKFHSSRENKPSPLSQEQSQWHTEQQQSQDYEQHHHHHSTCSWETLLSVSKEFELLDLQELAMKAIQHHCQMMTLQASINNNVMAEVVLNGFDGAKLDLQLVLGEQVLRSFLELYKSPLLKDSCQGLAFAAESRVTPQMQKSDTAMVVTREGMGVDQLAPDTVTTTETRAIPRRKCGLQQVREKARVRMRRVVEQQARDEQNIEMSLHSPDTISKNVLDGIECNHALVEMCDQIRTHFLRMREIMQGVPPSHQQMQ
ncbi:hypothetical protein BGZ99_009907 [Dissophora globulifera]|uniref:BTB domain-containing protein n=1 Tax=Dissophora globulifera TaxID=979702 RepID=A0A9P6RUC4_9FUNG|nr:hypothetical protein BGZ99_009907 [Dissophora globulifera]